MELSEKQKKCVDYLSTFNNKLSQLTCIDEDIKSLFSKKMSECISKELFDLHYKSDEAVNSRLEIIILVVNDVDNQRLRSKILNYIIANH